VLVSPRTQQHDRHCNDTLSVSDGDNVTCAHKQIHNLTICVKPASLLQPPSEQLHLDLPRGAGAHLPYPTVAMVVTAQYRDATYLQTTSRGTVNEAVQVYRPHQVPTSMRPLQTFTAWSKGTS
jgi:hypothetical protein